MPKPSLKDFSLLPEELNKVTKLLAKERGIKGYKRMSENNLLSVLRESQSKNKTKIEKIKEEVKELQNKFSKSEMKGIQKSLNKIQNKKSFSASKKIKKHLLILEENLSRLKKCYDYDHA